ncbi:MAG: TIR domain-containing protein [Terriglobales bacterium]|jgi:hypothetical protein
MPDEKQIASSKEVFISWSGPKSLAAAKVLWDWLPNVVQALKPWLSGEDLAKGVRWSPEIAKRLQGAAAGIICVTPSNRRAEWLLFEAGALSRTIGTALVCPVLFDLGPSDVEGPLAQFQLTRTTKDDISKLVKSLNSVLGEFRLEDARVERVFEVWWPRLEEGFRSLLPETARIEVARSERDILEEVLEIARNLERAQELTRNAYLFGDAGPIPNAVLNSAHLYPNIVSAGTRPGLAQYLMPTSPPVLSPYPLNYTIAGASARPDLTSYLVPTPASASLDDSQSRIVEQLNSVVKESGVDPRLLQYELRNDRVGVTGDINGRGIDTTLSFAKWAGDLERFALILKESKDAKAEKPVTNEC